ncbi:DUF3426 domain-containing protein [Magnetovibrio sp.]|uniref:DUF3426 domain-containing protein n=1 Tax=Magnetovibrio sp. TaxID=2024836 RepID=UPI002F9546A7
MIITCPNCATHYDIKPEAIKPTGSMMRCARCGFTWQQSVIHSVEVREQQITIPVAAAAAPAAPMPAAPPPPPPPPAPEPEPIPEPEPEPEPEPIPEPEPEPTPEPEPEPEPESEPLSQDELDNLFGDDETTVPPIESMIDTNLDHDEPETIQVEDDDIEPIPDGLSEPMPRPDDDEIPVGRPRFKKPPPENKKPVALIVASVIVVLLVGVALTSVLAKNAIMKAIPMTKDYYVMLGIHHPEPGEGLAPQNVSGRRDVRNAIDYLIVEGIVANVEQQPIHVPLLKVALTNADGKEIRVMTQELPKTQLEPGETVPFKVEFENPPGTARSMVVGFVNPEDAAAAENGGGENGNGGDGH